MDISQDITQLLSLFIISLTSIWFIFKILEYRKLPPGPFGVPILGYVPFIKERAHKVFADLEQKYGKVFSVSIGRTPCVVINDGSIAKDVLNNPSAYARPKSFNQIMPGHGGFAAASGKEWLEQRRFCFVAMKNLGMGRGEWETMIHDEAIEFRKEIKSWNGKPTHYLHSLEFFQINNMLSLLIGRRLCENINSPDAQILMDFTNEIIPFLSSASLASNAPYFILKLFAMLKIGGYDRAFQIGKEFENILRREIKRHVESTKLSNDQKPSFMDYYIEEATKQSKSDGTCYYTENNLIGNMALLFVGAIDTTTSSLSWLFLLTAANTDIQKKVHQEIDQVMGKDRLIYWDERSNLPYTMAVIYEMLRWVATAPVFPGRWTTEDIKVDKYIIPKNTVVMVNNWRVLHNPDNYENPEDFNPERFFKTDGNQKKPEYYFPFSTGKRNCPGEHVAMMTIFLFYTYIMQNFKISPPENETVKLADLGSSVVRHPVSQELCFAVR